MATKAENKEFEEYRRQMHGQEQQGETRSVVPAPHKGVRVAFGIFMMLVYMAMGGALICNVFNWDASFVWMGRIVGIVLVIYGVFRGYRLFKGSDYYGK